MLSLGSPESYINPRVYCFAGVELDVEKFQLRVDGKSSACPRKAFELLLLLCSAPESVIPRQQLLDALYPGGQVISDEALTQAIFRARSALGPYAGLIATVRGVGLRLDAVVTTHESGSRLEAAPTSNTQVAASPSLAQPGAGKRSLLWLAPLLLLAAAVTYFGLRPNEPLVLNAGFGLTSADLLNSQPDTADLLVEAFESEARAERSRAVALLEALHRNDESTPIPALFLSLWLGGTGDNAVANDYLEQARARVAGNKALYPNLLLDYVAAENRGIPDQVISAAGALLDLRPQAWRLHHARAHLYEYAGMREAALKEIRQIRVDRLDDRRLAQTLADRASMGDVEGAQAILDSLPSASDPAVHAFLNGRVSWSRGDFEAAHAFFSAAAGHAHEQARLDILRLGLMYQGVLEAMWGRDEEALATLERARNVAGYRSQFDEADIAMLLAQLHFRAGREAQAYAELDRALAVTPELVIDGIGALAQVLAMRIRPGLAMTRPESLPPETDALWRSAHALAQGDSATARQALAESLNLGVLDSRTADEARWLQLQLGLPVAAEAVIDPPHAPLSRIPLRSQIREALAETGATPIRP
ncbi:MAG TPA: winged helix-turn-helix domain-containing protein [Xanthomonadales bacterium]|nr:winged helix-turn-helix domain-containing protein [Xanthomonadales bacterium]